MSNPFSKEVAKAIANVAIFLEYADEEVLDQDAAIQVMEQFSSDLKKMSELDRNALSERLKEVSEEYDDASHEEFVFGLPEALGLNC